MKKWRQWNCLKVDVLIYNLLIKGPNWHLLNFKNGQIFLLQAFETDNIRFTCITMLLFFTFRALLNDFSSGLFLSLILSSNAKLEKFGVNKYYGSDLWGPYFCCDIHIYIHTVTQNTYTHADSYIYMRIH